MAPAFEIAPGKRVGPGQPCFVVAEVGQNHNGDVEIARRLIDVAAEAGVDAVKFCKRDLASELTHDRFVHPYVGRNSFAPTYGRHRELLELSPRQHEELQRHARQRGLMYFSTACDMNSVDVLESLDAPLYKIASRDLTNLPLLDYVGRTGKPVVLSCGMDGLDGISQALDTLRMHHDRLVLLQCTSAYPTAYEDVNLRVMETLRREFDVLVGLSDHAPGPLVPVLAAALGAVLVEKHITLDREMKGTDHAASLTPAELAGMVRDLRTAERALGDGVKRIPPSVRRVRERIGRAVVSRCRIARGTRLTEEMLCLKTGGEGLPWTQRQRILGKLARRDIPEDETLSIADVE